MKYKKQYNLDEAIKRHYQTEHLKPDFAASVADRVFGNKEPAAFTVDNSLYYIILIICMMVLVYCFIFMSHLNLSMADKFLIIPLIVYFLLSVKEMSILSRRYSEFD